MQYSRELRSNIRLSLRIALKLNDNRSAEKFLMHGAEIVGITSFQRHLVRKRHPDLRNHGNGVLLCVVAQLGAEMEKVGHIIFESPTRLHRGTVAAKGKLRREIESHVEFTKLLREDEPWLEANDLMAGLIAIAVDLARSRDVDWQHSFIKESVTRLQARRIEVKAVAPLV